MYQPPTTNDEPPTEGAQRLRKHRFTLADLLTFVTAIPVCIGVIAAIEFTASKKSLNWFGSAWHSDVRHFLVDNVGLPLNFVTGYVSFALIDLPAWACYAAIALVFGVIRSNWSFTIGGAFILSIFVWDLMSDYFVGFHTWINFRFVSLFGVVLATSCFAVTRRIRGCSHVLARRTDRIAKGFIYLFIVATVAMSIYGWWIVDASRRVGLEFQD